jgi:hypothetical protein
VEEALEKAKEMVDQGDTTGAKKYLENHPDSTAYHFDDLIAYDDARKGRQQAG